MTRSLLAAVLLLLPATVLDAAAQAPQDEKIALAVAYVGQPDSERGKDFVAFLGQQFTTVLPVPARALEGPAFAAQALLGAQVVVVDANLAGVLPDGYSKPLVLLSGPGVQTAEGLGAKLDWL